ARGGPQGPPDPVSRPQNGSVILYNRKKVKYRKDGYCWKKRKDGKTTREDHMKLKVQGVEVGGRRPPKTEPPPPQKNALRKAPLCVEPVLFRCGEMGMHLGGLRGVGTHKRGGQRVLGVLEGQFWGAGDTQWVVWVVQEVFGIPRGTEWGGGLCVAVSGGSGAEGCPPLPAVHGVKWGCGNGGAAPALSLEQLVQHVLERHQARPPPRTHACLCAGGLAPAAHEAGVAALRVACPPRLLSAAAPFEYRARGAARGPPGAQLDWLALDEAQFRLSILERLEQLETRLGALPPPAPPRGAPSETPPEQGPGSSFEARVVAICEAMMARPGCAGTALGTSLGTSGTSMLAHGVTFRGMTLLHLAAAQGYASLVEALRRWRALAVESLELEQEIDPLNVDHFSCTPLMWACALGHREAAERLCRWDRRALAVPDTLGRLPLALARARGHLALVTRLEELQMSPVSPRCHLPGLRIPSPLSASPDTGLSTASSLSSPSGLSEGPGSVPLPPGPPGPSEDESWGVAVPPSPPEDALALPSDTLQAEVVTLARQIIEATPERIKQEAPGGPPGALGALGAAGGTPGTTGTPGPAGLGAAMAWLATYLESVDRPPAPAHRYPRGVTFRGMTLLHLAAAQGYASLVEALRRWRALAVESLELEQEIDPLNVDHFSCTPLMWACALGHREAAERLCRWDRRALAVPDTLGRLPLALARARGHLALVTRLEELQMSPVSPRCHLPGLRIPSPLSASPDTGLSTASSLSSPSGLSEGPGSVPLPPGPPGPSEDESWGVAVPPSPPEDALALPSDTLQAEVVTLARQIIEATPERIKQEAPGGPPGALGALGAAGGTPGTTGTPGPAGLGAAMAWLATYLESVDRPPAPAHRAEVASRGSPGVPERPPPPSAAGWAEFLNASGGARGEGGAVALLTLSDQEQHELYEAARLVQGAFRKYRGRRLKEQQELAAAVIQRCYRKYKQFALFQRMTQAAILIQSKFRSYAEQKRFQRRRRAAVLIQQRFRSLRQHRWGPGGSGAGGTARRGPHRALVPPRSTFLTLKQDQAARKIMRFLRRCRHRMEELKQNKEVESLQTRGLAS
ncbi:calmodulin-binding transcription activator 2-like, partial [Pyrgilauda ruficollis]|uniref:calmodulin-binding transcription activator 2-like n=1 Tax=Pyrgilauda ruficollis TaxID=221976 RepID=UPI001B873398